MALRRSKRVKTEPTPSSFYLNSSYKETHEKFFSVKKVISERFIDYESLPKYPIARCFSGKNMIPNLLHVKGPAPLTPVRLFYSQIHLVSKEEQFFQTFIEGKTHRITPDVIAALLGLERPSEPVPYPPTSEDELIVSRDEFRTAVYHGEYRDALGRGGEIKLTHLKPIIKVLVKICQFNILPKLNNHDVTNLDTVYLSFLLLHGYFVDLSYVIWHMMAFVGSLHSKARGLPYGAIVGRLLSYLGHPFPADIPCADVPTPMDARILARFHLPCDPHYLGIGLVADPCSPKISRPPDDDDHNDISLPIDTPTESFASFDQGRLHESMQNIQHTMGVILFRFEQQLEEFKKQRTMIDALARQQDHLAQQQAQYHAMMLKYVQRAYPDQAAVCQTCGVTGYAELLIYCNLCRVSAEHCYCLGKTPKTDEKEVIWSCQNCASTASLKSQQGCPATNPKK